MSPQDEELVEALYGVEDEITLMLDDREPQVTVDGYDYLTLLVHFQDLVTVGVEPTTPGWFLAPGTSCSFSIH